MACIEELGGIPGMQVRHARSKETEFDASMLKFMQALYWIAKEDIAFRKWHSLKELLVQVDVNLSALRVGRNASYGSEQILTETLEALAIKVHDATSSLIQRSTVIGIIADVTTDISNVSQFDLHLHIVCNGSVTSRFGTFQPMPNTTSETLTNAILQWCKERGINVRRMQWYC